MLLPSVLEEAAADDAPHEDHRRSEAASTADGKVHMFQQLHMGGHRAIDV